MPVPETIKILTDQLGKHLFMMLGAKNISYGKTKSNNDDFLQFQIRGSKLVTHIQIIYVDHLDTYRIKFFKTIPFKNITKYTVEQIQKSMEPIADIGDIHIENLHEAIEKQTGLYVSINPL